MLIDSLDYFFLDDTEDKGNGIYKANIRSSGKINREALDSTYTFRVEVSQFTAIYQSVQNSIHIYENENHAFYVAAIVTQICDVFPQAVELISGVESDIRTQTSVTVTVRDINDNAPLFNQESYSIAVPEGLSRGTQLPGLNMVINDEDLVCILLL